MKVDKTDEGFNVKLDTHEAAMLRALVGSIGACELEHIQARAITGYSCLDQLTYGDGGEYDINDLTAGLWGFLR